MEYWDLYDKDKNKLNKIIRRGDKLDNGEFHLVVNAWIKNSKGQFLISQRAAHRTHPLMWECTGGSAICGETSLSAAIRELKEELGVEVEEKDGRYIGSTLRYYPNCDDILEVWLFQKEVDIKDVKMQEEEVNDVKWATSDEIYCLYETGKFEANAYFKEIINGEV